LSRFKKLGTKSCTITGGGEPLCYPNIKELIRWLTSNGIETGLVSNAKMLEASFNLSMASALSKLTWSRISVSNESVIDLGGKSPFSVVNYFKEVAIDWAFSYVVTDSNNLKNLVECINVANENSFTHVRIVDDIINEPDAIEKVKEYLKDKVDDRLVIYQGRKEYVKGHKKCLISLLKPNIGTDGYIYACCGIQFATNPPALDFDKRVSMGNDVYDIWLNQKCFDGSVCSKCYYSEYNSYMNKIAESIKLDHAAFV
jgi:MoaA/NifB/PqqE/SkfB family radical SAM enzyme